MLYGGSLAVGGVADSATLQHDRSFFEVAILRYGKAFVASNAVPLNADLTVDGHSQITLRMNRATPGDSAVTTLPAGLRLTLFSGMGTPALTGKAVTVRPIVSDESFVVQIPFSEFSNVDLTDVDGIDLSVFFEDFATLEIDDIFTSSGLPGDYNLNGVVDAADYAVWRDHHGQSSLPNRNPAATGEVGQADYDFWKSRFGQTFAMATASANPPVVPVPEPNTWALFGAVLLLSPAFLERR